MTGASLKSCTQGLASNRHGLLLPDTYGRASPQRQASSIVNSMQPIIYWADERGGNLAWLQVSDHACRDMREPSGVHIAMHSA
jgi:hypothetical protein